MDSLTPNTLLSAAEHRHECHTKASYSYENYHQVNGFQANQNIHLAEGYPYGSYLGTTPYDPRFQAYPPANVLPTGMAPYATVPYDPPFQAYPPANVFTPGLAPYTIPFEMGPPFAQAQAFATATTTAPSSYSTLTDNSNPEHSSNSSTAGNKKASKPRSVCITCGRDFSRASDMQRHAKKHGVSKYFQCEVAGCKYAGSYRKDKLDQHVKNVH